MGESSLIRGQGIQSYEIYFTGVIREEYDQIYLQRLSLQKLKSLNQKNLNRQKKELEVGKKKLDDAATLEEREELVKKEQQVMTA